MQYGSPLLFNQLFIDYLESIFHKLPEESYTAEQMTANMPTFYDDLEMVSTGIGILLERDSLIQIGKEGRDFYQANKAAIKAKELRTINEEKNSLLDLKIKELTEKILTYDLPTKKYYYWIELLKFLIGFGIGILTAKLT